MYLCTLFYMNFIHLLLKITYKNMMRLKKLGKKCDKHIEALRSGHESILNEKINMEMLGIILISHGKNVTNISSLSLSPSFFISLYFFSLYFYLHISSSSHLSSYYPSLSCFYLCLSINLHISIYISISPCLSLPLPLYLSTCLYISSSIFAFLFISLPLFVPLSPDFIPSIPSPSKIQSFIHH